VKLYKYQYNLTWHDSGGSPRWRDNVCYFIGHERLFLPVVIRELKEDLMKVIDNIVEDNISDVPHGSCQIMGFTPDRIGKLETLFSAGFQIANGTTLLHRTLFVDSIQELIESINTIENGIMEEVEV